MVSNSLNSKKIPAFTLAEVLVVLVVSGIILLMVFWAVGMVSNYFHALEDDLAREREVLDFQQHFEDLIEHSDSVFLTNNSLAMWLGNECTEIRFGDTLSVNRQGFSTIYRTNNTIISPLEYMVRSNRDSLLHKFVLIFHKDSNQDTNRVFYIKNYPKPHY